MTPEMMREARNSLGLTQAQMAAMLGYEHAQSYARMERLSQTRKPSTATVRLLQAYLDGYRPKDWPNADNN